MFLWLCDSYQLTLRLRLRLRGRNTEREREQKWRPYRTQFLEQWRKSSATSEADAPPWLRPLPLVRSLSLSFFFFFFSYIYVRRHLGLVQFSSHGFTCVFFQTFRSFTSSAILVGSLLFSLLVFLFVYAFIDLISNVASCL